MEKEKKKKYILEFSVSLELDWTKKLCSMHPNIVFLFFIFKFNLLGIYKKPTLAFWPKSFELDAVAT